MKTSTSSATSLTVPLTTAIAEIRANCSDSLGTAIMTIAHPRSLARQTPAWRPPTIRQPSQFGLSPVGLTISRRRVGAEARAMIRSYGETRNPAYLVTLRVTAGDGRNVSVHEAEAWIRALLPDTGHYSVHRLEGLGAPTYCWIVDSAFRPIESPASLFQPIRSVA